MTARTIPATGSDGPTHLDADPVVGRIGPAQRTGRTQHTRSAQHAGTAQRTQRTQRTQHTQHTQRTGGTGGTQRTGAGGSATPGPTDRRDPVLDLVRAAALLVVVMWHWAFTTLRWDDGPRVGNPIGETPGSWVLTWFLQVMPLFFLVGGTLHANALERHIAAGRNSWSFITARFRRLVIPVLPLLAVAATVAGAAIAFGRADVARGVVLMITPLWFLAVYLVLVVVAPLAMVLHRRFGLWAIVVATATLAVIDRCATLPNKGDLGLIATIGIYVWTWSIVHQLGLHLHRLRSAPRAVQAATCIGGFMALVVGASALGYPASMVGTHPEPISNMSPPNLMVVFLAIAQMGLLVVADAPLRRWCERHRSLLGTAGGWSMTIYVWHMLALAGFWGLFTILAGAPSHHVDVEWWTQRPLWAIGPLLFAVPLFALVGPTRRQIRAGSR